MATPLGAHPRGMTPKHLVLGLLCSLPLVACDAPEKSVGEENTTDDCPGLADCQASTGTSTGVDSDGQTSDGQSSDGQTSDGQTSDGQTTDGQTSSGGEDGLPEGFEDDLQGLGCSDLSIYAKNPADTVGLVFRIAQDLVATAAMSGETYVGDHDISEFDRFVVLVGTGVTQDECNDVFDPDATTIEQEWTAVAGTVSLEIIPDPEQPEFETPAIANVSITGLQITYDGMTEDVADLSFSDISVGWFPG